MSSDLVVVAGGLGFVGRELIADLKCQGHTNIRSVSRNIDEITSWKQFHEPRIERRDGVVYMSADLSDERQALGALRDARYVYNLAAAVGGIDFIQANRAACMLSAQININLLKACQKVGVQKYFFASSACVYSSNEFPCAENYAIPANPERGYGWEKLFGEQLCREFREGGDVENRVARLFTLYGPGDDKKHNHFPAELCKKIATAKILAHKEIELWGDGSQVRSLLFIDDCVTGIQKIMHSGVTTPLNLSSPEWATVNQMADMVQGIAGTDLQVNYVEGTVGVQSRYSDNRTILEKIGWEPSTPLREGLEKTWRFWWEWALKTLKP